MAKQVFDLHAGSGMSRGQSTEHLRNYKVTDPDMKKYGYFDPTREHLNFEVTKGGKVVDVNKFYHIDNRFKDNLKRRGIVDPNIKRKEKGLPQDRRTVANIIIGGSRAQMHRIAFGDQKVNLEQGADNSHIQRNKDIERWAVEMYNYIAQKYGEDNIIAFVVHLDEKNPHVHCTLLPVTECKKISYNKVFGGGLKDAKTKFLQCHNEVAEINKKWGLQRGDSVKETGAKHRTSEEYWRELSKKCSALEEKSGDLQKDNDKLQQEISLLRTAVRRAGIAEKSLTTMVQRKREEIEALREQLDNLNIETDWTREERDKELARLDSLIRKAMEQLKEKELKLQEAIRRSAELNEKLDELMTKRFQVQRQVDELETKLGNLKSEYNETLEKSMFTSYGKYFEINGEPLMRKLGELRAVLSPINQENLDNILNLTFLEEMARHGNEVIKVAAALFQGYVAQATQIAESAGGGGSPGGNWGRDKDDDDEKWKYKCFAMACMMVRPKPIARSLRRSR